MNPKHSHALLQDFNHKNEHRIAEGEKQIYTVHTLLYFKHLLSCSMAKSYLPDY